MQHFIEFHTRKQTYIVSQNPESVKSAFQTHDVKASDLLFSTNQQRKQFTKNLFLLALQEQLEKNEPEKDRQDTSSLALLARKILV